MTFKALSGLRLHQWWRPQWQGAPQPASESAEQPGTAVPLWEADGLMEIDDEEDLEEEFTDPITRCVRRWGTVLPKMSRVKVS